MNRIDILENQITSDVQSLRQDVREGLYDHDLASWAKQFGRVLDKMIRVNEIILGIEPKPELVQSPKDEPNFYE
jgi:hypothetical protein